MKFLKGELNLSNDVNFKFYFKEKSPQRDDFQEFVLNIVLKWSNAISYIKAYTIITELLHYNQTVNH